MARQKEQEDTEPVSRRRRPQIKDTHTEEEKQPCTSPAQMAREPRKNMPTALSHP